jgi:hypothetical protein
LVHPQRLIRHLAEPNTSPLRGNSSAVLAASQPVIRHLAEPNTSPLRGNSSAVLAASQPVIRHLAEPNTSPCGQPAAVQNAARFVELGSSIFREAK